MKFNISMAILLLAFLIDVEGAIANDKISLVGMVPAAWIEAIKAWDKFLLFCGTSLIGLLAAPGAFTKRVAAGAAAVLVAFVLLAATVSTARAGDLPAPATASAITNPFAQPYTLTACGAYFGVNSIGSNSSVSGATVQPGTQVVQGGIGGQVGYGCPINAATGSFWFAEVMADVTNLNGATNGLAMNGPAEFTERFGAGTPLNSVLSMVVPQGSSVAVPNLPTLPNGVTASPGDPYAFVALHEKDISLSNGLSQNREWLLSWGVGLGVRYRLSNALVADVFAEYTADTQSICVGPIGNAGCVKPGQGAMVGLAFDY
jgi:hypothetical protein